jgi:hypothetical protein
LGKGGMNGSRFEPVGCLENGLRRRRLHTSNAKDGDWSRAHKNRIAAGLSFISHRFTVAANTSNVSSNNRK